MQTLKEIRNNVATTSREDSINSLIDEYINLSLQEINDPAWAFEQIGIRGYNHNWSFNRRKDTLSISAETAQLPRDLDKIALVRQTSSPNKLCYVPDEVFYRYIPNPTATGNPYFYRLWEEEGISTRLAVADTINIVSSSTSDNSTYKVSIVGFDANGILQSEELSCNGTTTVNGTITYAANRPIRISKSAKTNGNITVTEHSGATTLVILGIEERSPRFKIIGVYPIVTTATTLYLEYYTRIRRLINDSDVPDLDDKWIYVVRLGALAKVRDYQNKPDSDKYQNLFASAVRSMIKTDMQNSDYIPSLRNHNRFYSGMVELSDENYSLTF